MAKKTKSDKKERPVFYIGALTKSGAVTLMKTYRDRVGATLLDKEPTLGEDSVWKFRVQMPWD